MHTDINEAMLRTGRDRLLDAGMVLPTVVCDAEKLPFPDDTFDAVVAINTIHNLDKEDCGQSLSELERVSKKNFIIVDAYRNDEEKERMYAWNLTAQTIMHVDEWIDFFKEHNYSGDYYWFTP